MKNLLPFAGLKMVGNSTVKAITTAQALYDQWSSLGQILGTGMDTGLDDGNTSCRADKTNNRLLLISPGIYKVTLDLCGTISAAGLLTLQLRKNGTVLPGSIRTAQWTNAVDNQFQLIDFVNVLATDNPGTISNFADPATTGFAGAGGAPKSMVALDLMVTGAASVNLTVKNGIFAVERVG